MQRFLAKVFVPWEKKLCNFNFCSALFSKSIQKYYCTTFGWDAQKSYNNIMISREKVAQTLLWLKLNRLGHISMYVLKFRGTVTVWKFWNLFTHTYGKIGKGHFDRIFSRMYTMLESNSKLNSLKSLCLPSKETEFQKISLKTQKFREIDQKSVSTGNCDNILKAFLAKISWIWNLYYRKH